MTDTPEWSGWPEWSGQPAPPPLDPATAPAPPAAAMARPRRSMVVAGVVAVAMFFAGAAGGAVIVEVSRRPSSGGTRNAALDTLPARPSTTQPSTTRPSTTPPSTTAPSSPSSPSTGDGPSASTTPAPGDGDNTVSTGVVDISTTLANDGGQAAGTGMVISSSGLVLTNNHVIENSSSIKAQIGGVGKTYNATVLGYDSTNDIALLQLQNASGLSTVTIGSASSVNIGDRVTAVGNALGRAGPPTVVPAVVTSLHEDITVGDDAGGAESLRDMIEVNGGIQPGDSGGPLLDASNRVIGMVTAGSSAGRRSNSSTTGFAIPIDTAKSVAQQIRSGKSSETVHVGSRGILGVQLQSAGGRARGGRGSTSGGATVAAVEDGSPAADAGMAAGDTIRSVAGTSVSSADEVGAALYQHHAGDKVAVSWVDSAGQQHQATVTLAEGPPA